MKELEQISRLFEQEFRPRLDQGFSFCFSSSGSPEKTNGMDLQLVLGSLSGNHVVDHIPHISASGISETDLPDDPQQRIGVGFGKFHPLSGGAAETVFLLLAFVKSDYAVEIGEEMEAF